MATARSRVCQWPACAVDAALGLVGGWRPFLCSEHAAPFPQLVPVPWRRCTECVGIALFFADKAAKEPTLCHAHASKAQKLRSFNSFCACCHSRASAGPESLIGHSRGAMLCSKHGKEVGFVDVVSPLCGVCAGHGEHCIAWFGPAIGSIRVRRQHCAAHREEGDVDNGTARKCTAPGCIHDASFCNPGEMAMVRNNAKFCDAHKPAGSKSVANFLCATCRLFAVAKRSDLCWTCRMGTDKAKRIETEVDEVLAADKVLGNYTTRDKAIPCRSAGMAPFRPDFTWVLPDRVLVLEVDEHAHRLYEPSCEIARLHQLHEAVVPLALAVLRYNPHADGHRESKHMAMRLHLRDMLHEALPADGLDIQYLGYAADRIEDLKAAAEGMHAAAEVAGKKRVRDDAAEGDGAKRARAGAGAGAGADEDDEDDEASA